MIMKTLKKLCTDDPVTSALFGSDPLRIYPSSVDPVGKMTPYAKWQIVGGGPQLYLKNTADKTRYSINIEVYGQTATEASTAAHAIMGATRESAYVTNFIGTFFDKDTKSYLFSFDVDFIL